MLLRNEGSKVARNHKGLRVNERRDRKEGWG